MEKARNPFNPGFGKVPPIYLGRKEEIARILTELGNPNSPYQTTMVYGMRGTGKTAFITDISREIEKRDNWIVVNLAVGSSLLPALVDAVYRKAESGLKKTLQAMKGITVSAFGITLNVSAPNSEQRQYQNLLEVMLRKLKSTGKWLLITLDEVKSTPEVRAFASVYQLMLRAEYNISLIMTGLPQNVSALQNDDVLTFLLRAGRIVLNPLDLWDVKKSYARAFAGHRIVNEDTLLRITRLTEGYAYAFQLLGYDLWEASDTEITDTTVECVLPDYKNDLYRNAYMKIYQSLTPREQDFVNAMAESKEMAVPVEEIGRKLGKEKNYISVYRRRLIDAQVVCAPRRGCLQFTLPLFQDFLRENRVLFQ